MYRMGKEWLSPSPIHHPTLTYRRLDVGADATEASAANPGSEVLKETDPGNPSR